MKLTAKGEAKPQFNGRGRWFSALVAVAAAVALGLATHTAGTPVAKSVGSSGTTGSTGNTGQTEQTFSYSTKCSTADADSSAFQNWIIDQDSSLVSTSQMSNLISQLETECQDDPGENLGQLSVTSP